MNIRFEIRRVLVILVCFSMPLFAPDSPKLPHKGAAGDAAQPSPQGWKGQYSFESILGGVLKNGTVIGTGGVALAVAVVQAKKAYQRQKRNTEKVQRKKEGKEALPE